MTMSTRITRGSLATTLATTVAATVSLALAAPALAATAVTPDAAGDVASDVDLLSVKVGHGEENLRVTLTHKNLKKSPKLGMSGLIYLDTDRSDAGPELVLAGGFFDGTDYQLLETEGFAMKTFGDPVSGDYSLRMKYGLEQVRLRISRGVLGEDTDEVRVAVKVAAVDGDQPVVDWLGKPRSWTPWVARA